MARLAFYTFGILREARGHAQVQGFFDRIAATFAAAEGTDGFVARGFSQREPSLGPRFFDPATHPLAPQTLSLWRDLESVFAFAYRGAHAEALRQRKEWFVEPAWPTYAAWWVEDGHAPSWAEAAERLEHLHDHGATPFAFSFKQAFDAEGQAIAVDRQRVTEKAASVR